MSVCTDDYPTTKVLYGELNDDKPILACLAVAGSLTLLCLTIFLKDMVFIKRSFKCELGRVQKTVLLLGLFPVTCVTSLIALAVPRSTVVMDMFSGCYLAFSINAFVAMTICSFGDEDQMILKLSHDKVKLSLPPCCCCLCCILRPITLTKTSLCRLKFCCTQAVILTPLLLVAATVLWADGRYDQEFEFDTAYPYISIGIGLSSILSIYGMSVIYKASAPYLTHQLVAVKFTSLQLMIVFSNLQRVIFNGLAQRDIPGCEGTRDSYVRGSAINNAVLTLEAFLLYLLARRGYIKAEMKQLGMILQMNPFKIEAELPVRVNGRVQMNKEAGPVIGQY